MVRRDTNIDGIISQDVRRKCFEKRGLPSCFSELRHLVPLLNVLEKRQRACVLFFETQHQVLRQQPTRRTTHLLCHTRRCRLQPK